MSEVLNQIIANDEYLYRGIIQHNWDYENNRPSSATFKDSKGVSVDRGNYRQEKDCIDFLTEKKDFFAVCKIQTKKVRDLSAIAKYLPIEDNVYHSEIHDSEERIQMRGNKPKKIRDASHVVFNN
jgi:hypothetical protein